MGPIRLTSSRARDVEIEKFTQTLDVAIDHGDITLRPLETPLSKINAHTRNGQVEITLPEKAAFDLKAATARGELSNDFGDALNTVTDRHEHGGGSITGTSGKDRSLWWRRTAGRSRCARIRARRWRLHNEKPAGDHIQPEIEKH